MSEDAVYAAIEGAVAEANENSENVDTSSEQVDAVDTSTDGAEAVSAEASETGETRAEPPVAEATGAADDEAAKKKAEEDEIKALERELIEKNPALGKGRLKLSRHQALLVREQRKLEEQHKSALQELQTKLEETSKQYETQEWKERLLAIQLAESNPEAFVRQVLMPVPEYQKVLDAVLEERSKGRAAAPESAAPADPGEMPAPDVLGADGSITYSADGARKLVQWHLAQAEQKFNRELASLRKEFEPVAKAHKTDAELRAGMERMKVQLDNARKNWPGFTDNEKAIAEWLRKPGNERATLHDAYREVVIPSFKTDRTKLESELREKILAELNKPKPRTSVAAGSVPPATTTENAGPRDIEDVIRESIARTKVAA